MSSWYTVSILGWIVTATHAGLTAFVVHGLWFYESISMEIEFFKGAVAMNIVMIAILLYARQRKLRIFKAK